MNLSISGAPHRYRAWPAVVSMPTGELVVSYCDTDEHMAPDGAIHCVISSDRGESWSSPIVVRDTPIDDRECGLTLLRDGTLLLHCWSTFHTPETYRSLPRDAYPEGVVERWIATANSPEYRAAEGEHGGWVLSSHDAGRTWTLVGRGPDSIHGGIHLSSGEILVASYREEGGAIGIDVASPTDLQWSRRAAVHCPRTAARTFGEPHVAELPNGRVTLMIRTTKKNPYSDSHPENFLWMSYSDDGGQTWAEVSRTDIWGLPPHILVLGDGRLLCTYGHRRAPYGVRACISDDGARWDTANEIVIRDDAPNGDLGYPHSLEIDPGRILTVYYQIASDDPADSAHPPRSVRRKAEILGTLWDIPL